ncbi:MAG: carboxypeptidase-like regulatory domain-containing protein [Methanomassiliicoccales archaeon]|jgi:hypothetical protein|nr:carboxypeptidase-like regulatory domain-containing protein [Methanomassiliicoccales archaeon]
MKLIQRNIRNDREGGIEGLPLQLILMVVIAGIGMTIVLGWMTGLEAPKSIGAVYATPNEIILTDENSDGLYEGSDLTLTITVVDQNGDPVSGASVVLQGMNIGFKDGRTAHGMTDASGKVKFVDLSLSQRGATIGFVTVTVTKSGYGTDSSLSIPVISE